MLWEFIFCTIFRHYISMFELSTSFSSGKPIERKIMDVFFFFYFHCCCCCRHHHRRLYHKLNSHDELQWTHEHHFYLARLDSLAFCTIFSTSRIICKYTKIFKCDFGASNSERLVFLKQKRTLNDRTHTNTLTHTPHTWCEQLAFAWYENKRLKFGLTFMVKFKFFEFWDNIYSKLRLTLSLFILALICFSKSLSPPRMPLLDTTIHHKGYDIRI